MSYNVNIGAIISELENCRDIIVKSMRNCSEEEYDGLRASANAFQQALEIVFNNINVE